MIVIGSFGVVDCLRNIIRDKILADGAMSVGAFMSLALGHPQHGYYMKRDPFGRAGDFVTAPEVSQMFGEVIGAWVADIWQQMGAPERFVLLECGPGRGTLMADILRATRGVAGFHAAVAVHLLEMSPVLKTAQAKALDEFDVVWHEGLDDVPRDAPMIVVGNEFLDALPFTQFVKMREGWAERVVNFQDDGFCFAEVKSVVEFDVVARKGDVFEYSTVRNEFIGEISGRLKTQGGVALFIDYGHVKSGVGDTFQGIKGHEYVDVFSDVGDVDLTSHVDFEALVAGLDARVFGAVEQGAFLKALRIGVRAAALCSKGSRAQVVQIEKDLHRLTHSDQMGALFKVIGFTHDSNIKPAGFG